MSSSQSSANPKQQQQQQQVTLSHPKVKSPVIDFASISIRDALGRKESRIAELSSDFSKNEYLHKILTAHTGSDIKVPGVPRRRNYAATSGNSDKPSLDDEGFVGVSPLLARNARDGVWEAMRMYRASPIHLQINVISNPILSAEVLAKYIAREMKLNRQLPRIYKNILSKLC
jgi:hypothetical protein